MRFVYNIRDITRYFRRSNTSSAVFKSKAMPMLSKIASQPGSESKKTYRSLNEIDLDAYERLLQYELAQLNASRRLIIKDLKTLDRIRSHPDDIE